jgi:putative heme transporter
VSLAQCHGFARRAIANARRYSVFIAVSMLLIFGTVFIIGGRGEIAEAFRLIGAISPAWFLLLALIQAVVLLIAAWTYQVVLRRQGHRIGLMRLLEIHLQRVVIGAVTPVGGPASIYVLVRSLRTHRVSDSDSLIVASIKGITGVLAFLIFLVPALLLQPPNALVTAATVGLIVVLGATLLASVLVLRQREAPAFVQRWAPESVLTFIKTAQTHQMTAVDFAVPTALSFASHALTALMLLVGLHAVGYPATVGTALIGYVVGKLFFMMAPVFQGIGIVEIGMALALQQAGAPSAVAVSGALLFRIGDLWLPLSWGFIVQLIRMPLMQHLRNAWSEATTMVAGITSASRAPWSAISARTVKLGRLALVVESPLTLMIGVLLVVAGGLPSLG